MQRAISIGDRYRLSPDERDEIKALAKERTLSNRDINVRDSGIGPSSGLFKDMIGAAGEWAFACLANVNFDSVVSPHSYLRGEDKGDTIYRGCPMDIKSTHYPNGKMIVVPWKSTTQSRFVYGLMVMVDRDGPTFSFRGFSTPETVQGHPDNFGYGPTFAVPQKNLVEWFNVAPFLDTCDTHKIVACLDCPDPYFDEPEALAVDLRF